jgi:hypothetical protein
MAIERVAGERHESYLEAELLRPLAMNDSTFAFVSQDGPHGDPRLAMGHFDGGAPQPTVPLHLRPAGQFTTTALDMGRFARFLISDGQGDGKRLVASDLLRAMGRPTTTEAVSAGLDVGYARGLNTRDRHGVVANCHVGTTVGFRANFCLFPKEQKAFFVAMNADVETADYDRFDALLIQILGIPIATPASVAAPPSTIRDWQGVYVLTPNRMEAFAYFDRVLNSATVTWNGSQLDLKPFQGARRSLLPMGGWLFRKAEKTLASHVLLVSHDARQVISDGFRSCERAGWWRMAVLWGSLFAGIIGLLYLMSYGAIQLSRRRLRYADPLFIAALASIALFLPLPFFASQSFLQLGDLTTASALLALVTAVLPLAMLVGLWHSYRRTEVDRSTLVERLAMLSVLQWCIVLAFWQSLPLLLWA